MMLFVKGPAKAHPVHCWSASGVRPLRAKLKEISEQMPAYLFAIADNDGCWLESNTSEFTNHLSNQPIYQGHLRVQS